MSTKEPFFHRMLRWMRHDVKVCMDHGALVGAITLMLAHTAALAGFYSGRKKACPTDDHDEFMSFFNDYYKKFNQDPARDSLRIIDKKGKEKDMIYTHLRCGLIHEHLMKRGTGIEKGAKPYIYISSGLKSATSREGDITINVDLFFKDYLETLDDYYLDVTKNKNKLKKKFIDRAKYLGAYRPYL